MQAALVTGQRKIEFVEFPEPQPTEHHTVVTIAYCGICGTDLHAFMAGGDYNPSVCGHEWVGHVSACATVPNDFKEGDRVAIGVGTACGKCAPCRRGDAAHCQSVFAAATFRDPLAAPHGGFASAIAFSTERLYHVPTSLTDEAAGLLEPATVAVHAMRRTDIKLGDSVVVIGAGPIGLLVAQCARLAGAGQLIVLEPEPERRNLALHLGADAVFDPTTADFDASVRERIEDGADIVFECAGVAPTIQQAVELSRRGGQVSLVGVAVDQAQISPVSWLIQEVSLTSNLAYLHEDFDITKNLVADGRLRLEMLHTSTVALADIEDAFVRLAAHPTEVKILVDPTT